MKKLLKNIKYKQINTENVTWLHKNVYWDFKNIRWNVSNIRWNVANISWSVDNISWNVDNIRWVVSNIIGNIDSCEISNEERKKWINIQELISNG